MAAMTASQRRVRAEASGLSPFRGALRALQGCCWLALLALPACSLTDLNGLTDGTTGAIDAGDALVQDGSDDGAAQLESAIPPESALPEVSDDGPEAGSDSPTQPDGEGPDAADGAVSDSGVSDAADETLPEASSPDADAAPALSGCVAKVGTTFCADFDGTDPLALFSEVNQPVAIQQAFAKSAPNGLSIDLGGDAGGCVFAGVVKNFVGTFTAAAVEVAIRPETAGSVLTLTTYPEGGGGVFYNLMARIGGPMRIYMVAQKAGSTSIEYAEPEADTLVPLFNAWATMELSFETSPARVARFRMGGAEVQVDLPDEFPLRQPSFSIGTWCESKAVRYSFDDVAIWLTP